MIADSPDMVRMRAREQLMLGATQIKLTAGGGVASPHSPIDVSTFTEAELRAAVEAAENWGTYVDGACLYAGGDPARDRGRRQMHRARPSDGRSDRQADGGQGHLAQHPAVPRRRGRRPASRPARSSKPRKRRSSPAPIAPMAGQEIRNQDRLRHRHSVFPEARTSSGRDAGEDDALVQRRRDC